MTLPVTDEGHGGRRGMFMQILTTVALSMTHFSMGSSVSFSGVLTEQLTSADADIALTASQVSWVASAFSIGNMVGFVLSSYVNPRLGTVRVVQLCAPTIAVGWTLMAFGSSFWMLMAGRTLVGVTSGTCLGPTVTHLGEVASAHVRGSLTTCLIANACFGIMCTYLFGWLLGWRHSCLAVGIGPMLLQFLITLMLPRSAKWLVSKGHPVEEAQRSLRFYHGDGYDVDRQIKEIRESLGDSHKHDASLLHVFGLLRQRQNLLPFLLILSLHLFFVYSGGLVATAFGPVVFKDVGGSNNPYLGSVLLGAVRMVTTIFCSIIMERVERKVLLMLNGVVGAAACLTTGCYFVFKDQLADYDWISMVSILVVVCFMSIGISPLMNVMFSELLPNAIRSEVGGVCLLFFGGNNFIMTYTFPLAVSALGMQGVFWFFTAMHVAMFFFAMFCLPHTRGKSIEEIQKLFVKNITNTVSDPVHIHVEERRGSLCAQTLEERRMSLSAETEEENRRGSLPAEAREERRSSLYV